MVGHRMTVLVLAMLLVGALASGCTGSDEGDASAGGTTNLNGINPKAEVDPETAVVTLPVDYVALGEQEDSSTIWAARDAAIAQCAREELNIPWVATAPDPYIPAEHMWARYGPWTKPVAEKFAFVDPMGDGALIVNGIVEEPEGHEWIPWPNEGIPEEQRSQTAEVCNSKPEVQRFDEVALWVNGPGQQALNDESNAVNHDVRMQELFGELEACYINEGMEMDPELPGYVVGAEPKINEEQIALALKTVECKDQVNFTRRAADITAERQIPIIEEHADELFAVRKKWDDTVAEAESYIAAHPELFEPPK